MSKAIEAPKLAALAKSLPGQIRAAELAVTVAERDLARILTFRATGGAVKPMELAAPRMALARAIRNVEDLQKIQALVFSMLEPVRVSAVA